MLEKKIEKKCLFYFVFCVGKSFFFRLSKEEGLIFAAMDVNKAENAAARQVQNFFFQEFFFLMLEKLEEKKLCRKFFFSIFFLWAWGFALPAPPTGAAPLVVFWIEDST